MKKHKVIIAIFLSAFLMFQTAPLFALTSQEERNQLEKELAELEKQIAQYEQNVGKTQQQKKTLQNQIDGLKKKIAKLNLQIQQSNAMVKDIKLQIQDTESSITKTEMKINDAKEKLAHVLRSLYEQDRKPLAEILLAENDLSGFFNDVASLESLSQKNKELLKSIKGMKTSLENEKVSLGDEKSDLEQMLKIQMLQKKEQETTKNSAENLLETTKGKETEYQKLLEQSRKRAQEIKARIFEIIGVAKAPTFGEALAIAKYVEGITGVRPAFLLAVLTQESNIGANVGQCYLSNPSTGEGIRVNNRQPAPKTMNPTRDVPPFLSIVKDLGRDAFNTLVSCPMSYGWGGAMGPAQFIPSTWTIYKDRISSVVGKASDPWAIKDSFLAAGLLLADNGANKKTANAEWRAAMLYFSGTTNTKYRFYGDSIARITQSYEQDIKDIESGSK